MYEIIKHIWVILVFCACQRTPVTEIIDLAPIETQKEISNFSADWDINQIFTVKLADENDTKKNVKPDYNIKKGDISMYDDIFKKYSVKIGWDWRLLAALVYQESRFIPDIRSKRGAYGLMQIMPATLSYFGADTTSTPDQHIAAGVAYIKYLDRLLVEHVTDESERIKFILASYNIGPGHIFDARRLAEKYGKDANIWENNVDSFLLRKSEPQYYNDPEVRNGKCYGNETLIHVRQIMEQYERYKNL